MNASRAIPIIGIIADRKMLGDQAFHAVGEKYITAVMDGAGGEALLIPSLADRIDQARLIARIDGLLLPGSHSNVEPCRYGGPDSEAGTLHDAQRDAIALLLIRAAVAAAVPVLGICRGFQEMNVAFGGSLHQQVHRVSGMHDHREIEQVPEAKRYGPAHTVDFAPDGQLAVIAASSRAEVNSLHSQGIDRLGQGLTVEARAPDGLVEAFRVTDAKRFALAVQWHPEWHLHENSLSIALFRAFGEACRQRLNERR
ncbi:MAG: gamma-glutamyl-gamma-aminobutyrate hydrolase family protein [Thiogranum sp.]|nr:gamma-glutamyl-gamma-aminobutyrate hydrolase family protein [Thiogranum sp.]